MLADGGIGQISEGRRSRNGWVLGRGESGAVERLICGPSEAGFRLTDGGDFATLAAYLG